MVAARAAVVWVEASRASVNALNEFIMSSCLDFSSSLHLLNCMGARAATKAARTSSADGGRGAVTTRAVSAAARVQPPTIYRQFGDMRGLLDAVE